MPAGIPLGVRPLWPPLLVRSLLTILVNGKLPVAGARGCHKPRGRASEKAP